MVILMLRSPVYTINMSAWVFLGKTVVLRFKQSKQANKFVMKWWTEHLEGI